MLRRSPLQRGSASLKRTGFKRKPPTDKPAAEDGHRDKFSALFNSFDPSSFKVAQVITTTVTAPLPKTSRRTNKALRDLAKGQHCLLCVPGVCNHRTDTTVGCHGNSYKYGKGDRRKSCDIFMVWGCSDCHFWLDQGNTATYEQKQNRFEIALAQQFIEYTRLQQSLPPNSRMARAVTWAIEQYEYDGLTIELQMLATKYTFMPQLGYTPH